MKFEHSLYQKPLSMTGFGGGATSLSVAGAGGPVNPFDDMSNFSGATRVGSTDVIYYGTSGTYQFTDPNAGLSRFRFTVVGGGGASEGDGGGWFSNTGAGGGGAARGEIQTSATLDIGVAQGGGSPAAMGLTVSSPNSGGWIANSNQTDNGINRRHGTGGLSYVKETSVGVPSGSPSYSNVLMVGRGGSIGLAYYAYYSGYSTAYNHLYNGFGSSGFGNRYSGHSFWDNGGTGHINASGSGAGVNVTNGVTETGGSGGSGFHNSSGTMPSNQRHFLDVNGQATNGENTTYAGGGGGGGASHSEGTQMATGGTASGLASLLAGTSITPAGGNGTHLTTKATAGVAGGGHGGNSHNNADTWMDVHYGGSGIVIVEFLGF